MEPGGDSDVYRSTAKYSAAGQPLARVESNRTLLDIIREEGGGPKDNRKSWRHFKEKLRRKNSAGVGRGSAWTSTVPVPTSDIPINGSRSMSRHPSDISAPSLARNPSRASGRFDYAGPSPMRRLQREENNDEDEEDWEEEEGGSSEGDDRKEGSEEDEEQRPVRMSLMSLLAETDKQMGVDGLASYMMDEDEDDDDDEDEGGGENNNCCVCMVRHKGTAFVPCGHSFCRLCSREMWVDRGNCPLCNNYILEILDIF